MDGYPSSFQSNKTDAEGNVLFSGGAEEEITTLMGQRFVVLKAEKGNAANSKGITLELLMLPPHEGYLADLKKAAELGKAMLLFVTRKSKEAA